MRPSGFTPLPLTPGRTLGVEKYDPVITSEGLVGLVSEVGPNYAKVLTILDVTVEAGAYDIRTRDIGTTGGDITLAADGRLRLNMLPRDSGVSQGDLIYTTGYGWHLSPGHCHRRGGGDRHRLLRYGDVRCHRAAGRYSGG